MDIYAAEYEIKMDKKKNISELKQTTSLHMKLEDADGLDKHELYKQRRDAIEADGVPVVSIFTRSELIG